MKPCDGIFPAFPGVCEDLEPIWPTTPNRGLALPPHLYDLNPDSPLHRLRRTLDWVSEAQDVILSQQERIAHLEALTTTDELTGLLNRRGFYGHFRRELAHAQRDPGASGVVAMIDLDGFKTINDSLGHDAGDAVLRRVAALLGTLVRRQDVVARLGGDELAALLTNVDAGQGEARVQAIAGALKAETVSWQGRVLPIALSVGCAPYGVGDTEDAVMRRADTAMYADKAARGRTRRRPKLPSPTGR